MLRVLILLLSPYICAGYYWWMMGEGDEPDWNGLKVSYESSWYNPFMLDSPPRLECEAMKKRYKLIKDECSDERSEFIGRRFWKNNDPSHILIYDKNGYIAGMQIGIPESKLPRRGEGFGEEMSRIEIRRKRRDTNASSVTEVPEVKSETDYLKARPFRYPFVVSEIPVEGETKTEPIHFITVYFVEPEKICDGREIDEFEHSGTGTDLYIQNGTRTEQNTMSFILIEHDEDTFQRALGGWKKEKCLWTIGQLYSYNFHKESCCDEMFPLMLIYNDGRLSGFCILLKTEVDSRRWEHPPKWVTEYFLEDSPKCMAEEGGISMMHVFFTNNVFGLRCRGPRRIMKKALL